MKEKNSYSRIIQSVAPWEILRKGEIIEMFQHCVEQDITTFIHDSYFGRRKTGELLGTALSESGLSRDEIQLISKMPGEEHSGFSMTEAVENELLQLETDYIDLFLLRKNDLSADNISSVEQLLYQGKIKEIGGIDFEQDQIEKLSVHFPVFANFTGLQDFNFIDQEKSKNKMIRLVLLKNVREFGFLKEQELVLREIGEKYNLKPNQVFLAWILNKFPEFHPVISPATEDEIKASTDSRHIFFPPKDLVGINSLFD
ncbi:MAG TPA: aldo/keto reductase [Salinimicrobium sp.]|nr:aldo/keto reductase [Salinimicrobium sp.]